MSRDALRADIERMGAPLVRQDAACAYDMNEVERQPRVRAGQWVTLPNGERVVLRTAPKAQQPLTYLGDSSGRSQPELLFYRYNGGLQVAAINGYSIIGLMPTLATDRATGDAVVAALRKRGRA